MITPSTSSMSKNSRRPYSDLPPSYDVVEAEPHGFIDGRATMKSPRQNPPEPPVSERVLSKDLTQNDMERIPLFLDPTTGGPHVAYTARDEVMAQCMQYGHVEKTKFGAWSILAAIVFFPWGLLCMVGARVVYCTRCGLVLRGLRAHKDTSRGHQRRGHPSSRRGPH